MPIWVKGSIINRLKKIAVYCFCDEKYKPVLEHECNKDCIYRGKCKHTFYDSETEKSYYEKLEDDR